MKNLKYKKNWKESKKMNCNQLEYCLFKHRKKLRVKINWHRKIIIKEKKHLAFINQNQKYQIKLNNKRQKNKAKKHKWLRYKQIKILKRHF